MTKYKLKDLIASPDGKLLAFNTDSLSSRVEDDASYEIYTVEAAGAPAQAPKQLTHNHAIEETSPGRGTATTSFFSRAQERRKNMRMCSRGSIRSMSPVVR